MLRDDAGRTYLNGAEDSTLEKILRDEGSDHDAHVAWIYATHDAAVAKRFALSRTERDAEIVPVQLPACDEDAEPERDGVVIDSLSGEDESDAFMRLMGAYDKAVAGWIVAAVESYGDEASNAAVKHFCEAITTGDTEETGAVAGLQHALLSNTLRFIDDDEGLLRRAVSRAIFPHVIDWKTVATVAWERLNEED